MAKIAISALTTGTPKGTDLTPATDTTDTTQAASGTTKKYIRSDELNFYIGALGVSSYSAVVSASTGALTATYANGALGVGATLTNAGAQAAFALDGVTAALNDRVLIKNQAAPEQNGIYTVTTLGTVATNWVLTRATDMDQAAEVIQYKVVFVDQGSTNANTTWQVSDAGPYVIGTTAINYNLYTLQSGLTFPLALSLGGTEAALTASNGGVVFSNATTMEILAGTATAGQMLRSGANAVGSWSTATWPATTTINSILYSSANNVVGEVSPVARSVLTYNGTSVPTAVALTDGQLIIGSTAGAPAAATLTAGTGISIVSASNSITLSVTGGGLGTVAVAGTSQSAAVNTTYVALNAGQTTLTLPSVYSFGDRIELIGSTANTGGFVIVAAAGDTIMYSGAITTAGGSITSSAVAGQAIELICDVANTSWVAVSSVNTIFTTA